MNAPGGPGTELVTASSHHAAQFYVDDATLTDSVARFLLHALRASETAVVIATPEHRAALSRQLTEDGIDVQRACADGQLTMLDARGTLERFMVGRSPDSAKFRATIGDVFDHCRRARPDRELRAYGEMVDLLCFDGQRDAAIQLERLWNQLASEYRFSLLCSYSMQNFHDQADRVSFEAICETHTAVSPTERYWEIESHEGRLREISRLQQRAAALETEIARRSALEQELLASRRELQDFVENAVVALHCVGADGTVLWANKAELTMLGYQPDEYLGHHIAEFHADSRAIRGHPQPPDAQRDATRLPSQGPLQGRIDQGRGDQLERALAGR